MSIRSVIIPAAGKGTRLMPATKVTAKELLPVFDRVAIDFAVEEAVGVGAERIIVVISASKLAIQRYLGQGAGLSGRDAAGPEVIYVFQDRPLGLGHAVLCCKDMALPGPVGVILPDDIIMGQNCLAEMAAKYLAGHMVAAMAVPPEETAQYGIFRVSGLPVDRCIPVSGMVEKPTSGTAPSSIAAVGRYILDPMIFDILSHTPPGKGGEIQLTDAIAIAAIAKPLVAFQFSGTRHDCGNHDGLLGAAIARQAEARSQSGFRVQPPAYSVATTHTIHDILDIPKRAARPAEATALGF